MSSQRKKTAKKPCQGEIVRIGGHDWCVGEKIQSKWKHSKLNKTKKTKKQNKTAGGKRQTQHRR
jgi:hypothetical protein